MNAQSDDERSKRKVRCRDYKFARGSTLGCIGTTYVTSVIDDQLQQYLIVSILSPTRNLAYLFKPSKHLYQQLRVVEQPHELGNCLPLAHLCLHFRLKVISCSLECKFKVLSLDLGIQIKAVHADPEDPICSHAALSFSIHRIR